MRNHKDWVPQWAKTAIWYQIFPERFRNGRPENNPSLIDIQGAWPHDADSPWQVHPWTSDWYALQPYEQKNGQSIWYNLIRRRYGGDLQGIMDKLDYLQDLGVTALYLNPVFESPSHHKYDGTVYHHIDRTLGPDPEGDSRLMAREDPADSETWQWTAADETMLKLISEVHGRGMCIIFDGVFNHVGINNPFFRDVVKNQQKSPYKDWFAVDSWEDGKAGTAFQYSGWFGVPELPEWRQDENGIAAGPRQYIFDCTKRWMAPFGKSAEGIDGWRLDVAFCIRHSFWKAWRKHVKSINPDAYLTAEVIAPRDQLAPYLQGDEFDAVMNYNVGFACADYFINRKKRIRTSDFDRMLRELREAFDPCVSFVQQNLTGSHDTNRLTSHIMNPDGVRYREWDVYHRISKAEMNQAYNTRKPDDNAIETQKLILLFLMTYVGAPMIYYGDETGLWGANDPCCRKPMIWPDLIYDAETVLPDGRKKTPETVEVNQGLFETYRRLILLRRKNKALSLGDFVTVLVDDAREIFAFARQYGAENCVVALNNSLKPHQTALHLDKPGQIFEDVLNGGTRRADCDGVLHVWVKGRWGAVLKEFSEA